MLGVRYIFRVATSDNVGGNMLKQCQIIVTNIQKNHMTMKKKRIVIDILPQKGTHYDVSNL